VINIQSKRRKKSGRVINLNIKMLLSLNIISNNNDDDDDDDDDFIKTTNTWQTSAMVFNDKLSTFF
jgi:hypothetical protein